MKKIVVIGLIIILIFTNFSITSAFKAINYDNKFSKNILYVGGSGAGNYSSIQEAIDNASNGDTVFVFNGTYYENVLINRSITLTGYDKVTTIINGTKGYYCISIESQDVIINNFTIKNSRTLGGVRRGIRIIKNSDNAKIFDCIFTGNCWDGIFVQNTEYVTIEKCEFLDNLNGISQWDANYSTIHNCDFVNDQDNIYFQRSDKNTISNCTMKSSISTHGNQGIYLIYSSWNVIYNCSITDIGEGISLYTDSSFNTIDDCDIIDSVMRGLVISGSVSNKILNSTIATNGESGIEFFGKGGAPSAVDTEYNTIDNCVINGNNDYGVLYMPNCHYNEIINSEISNNIVGVNTRPSTYNNRIFNNKFIDNTEYQAYDAGNNIWNDSYPHGGNYWSDYPGVDQYNGPDQDIVGSDGIGDMPYAIPDGQHADHYPLVTLDEEDPEVKIIKPISGLYLFNLRLRKFFLHRLPLIIGRITIEVDAKDNDTGIRNVEFYINGKLEANITSEPFSFKWTGRRILKHRHTFKVVAFDFAGNNASDEITVRKYL